MDAARTRYDVIVVGAGPAGIFAALELVRRNGASVLLVERGPDIDRRACPARKTGALRELRRLRHHLRLGRRRRLLRRQAHALDRGRRLARPLHDQGSSSRELVDYVDGVWLEYGAPQELHGGGKKVEKIRREALLHGMTLVPAPDAPHGHRARLRDPHRDARRPADTRVTLRTGTMVERILAEKRAGQSDLRATGVVLADGTRIEADAVIVAPGREGAALARRRVQAPAHRHAHQPRRHRRPRRGAGGRHGAAHQRRCTRAS